MAWCTSRVLSLSAQDNLDVELSTYDVVLSPLDIVAVSVHVHDVPVTGVPNLKFLSLEQPVVAFLLIFFR